MNDPRYLRGVSIHTIQGVGRHLPCKARWIGEELDWNLVAYVAKKYNTLHGLLTEGVTEVLPAIIFS
jgi:hypothetical protein